MHSTTNARWAIVVSILAGLLTFDPRPAQSQSSGSPTLTPRSERARPNGPMRGLKQPNRPGQQTIPDRSQALEDRLRRGETAPPTAQGQVSEWLEQLHRGGKEGPAGDTPTREEAR
ncbi:MAG: hypothetical protein L6Q34_02250 [Nitrospira sp.]|nr:hypothetical protein [Nitrospira sp. NTP2]MCK6492230.1 hypothetical protein [Nitrospira sp.]MEB2339072.1 hypothetical protein [Nitrospirales bacterium]QOJ35987.1 MAG: hypothetical protein HRU82_13980 [Nitrospira sp.]RIK60908.1 MAG: hypothetical protein DCC63_01755 [Nitrospira sp.]